MIGDVHRLPHKHTLTEARLFYERGDQAASDQANEIIWAVCGVCLQELFETWAGRLFAIMMTLTTMMIIIITDVKAITYVCKHCVCRLWSQYNI